MGIEDILAKIKATENKEPTGEEVRIQQAKEANAELHKVIKEAAPNPTPDRPSTHIKEQYGGNLSDIPVGHSYWGGRYRKH